MNGFRSDDEPSYSHEPLKEKTYSSNISQNYNTKSSYSVSDKSSKQQMNSTSSQPNTLGDLAAVVRSTSKDGQVMPGHRLRQKASCTLSFFYKYLYNIQCLFRWNSTYNSSEEKINS